MPKPLCEKPNRLTGQKVRQAPAHKLAGTLHCIELDEMFGTRIVRGLLNGEKFASVLRCFGGDKATSFVWTDAGRLRILNEDRERVLT